MRRMIRTIALTPRARGLLSLIRRHGTITRSELIRESGLSGTAVFRGTQELEAAGLVRAGDPVAAGRGQPSTALHLISDAVYSVGLSVMTDRADVVLVDLAGTICARREVTLSGMPRDAILRAGLDFAEQALADAGQPIDRLYGLGVAVAGYFIGEDRLNPGVELDEWALVDLREPTLRLLGLPVEVENVASAAAMGERLLGTAGTYGSFCYVNVAAGFGAGVVLDGRLWRGHHGNAGEIAGLFPLAGRPTPNLANLLEILRAHDTPCTGIADMVGRFDPTWPGVSVWLNEHQASFDYFFNALRFMLDCEAIVLGGRLPRALARRIVEAVNWPEQRLPDRRGHRAPGTLLTVAEVEPELAASVGAASLVLHRDLFA